MLEAENDSFKDQTVSYQKTERVGHEVSQTIKAKEEHIEAAVGYTFSYEYVTTTTVNVVVSSGTTLDVFLSDVRIRQQYVSVKKQTQRATNIFGTAWKDIGSPTTTSELIREYDGVRVQYIETEL